MRKVLSILLSLCLLCSTVPFRGNAEELLIAPNPLAVSVIQIANASEFMQFSQDCRLDSYSAGKTISLEADLDLTGLDFTGIPIFSGMFYGNGHCISGVDISNDGSKQGFFRILTETAEVRDLHIKGTVTPGGSGSQVGGIAGSNAGTIYSCSFAGTVSGTEYVGGIAGSNSVTGIVEECSASGSVYGTHFVGGICGSNAGVIRTCQNQSAVNTAIQQNTVSLEDITLESLTDSESAATVTDIGGICGVGTGLIRDCANAGSVGYPQIGYNIGGIAGRYSGYILNCTNEGAVDGRKEVGGILGQLEPAVSMTFAEDTLQILQGQMDTMSALTDRTASNAQASASALDQQLKDLESHVTAVQGALDTLLPDEENPLPPDPDTILAAQNTLSSSMAGISGTLESIGSTGESALNTTYQDMLAISNQMNVISGTIGTAEENLNGSISDISDSDTDADTTAKIDRCVNNGTVNAGWNTGGIVGAISFENDLDPASDLQIIGSTSANFAYEYRAVVTNCENTASVTGKKQNTGGIIGWMTLGLVKNCINAGTVTGSDYTGGIAGHSRSYIRYCIARCLVRGSVYTGGIAGSAATLADCNALVQIKDASEKYGAILGHMAQDTALENNHYLPVGSDIGGVDGISYEGKAQALAVKEFFALETLPEKFHYMTVTFHFENDTEQLVTVLYASKLSEKQVPDIPPVPGYESRWTGDANVTDQLFFDTDFYIVRTAHIPTLASEAKASGGLPILLAEGDFLQNQSVGITQAEDCWQLALPESQTDLHLRFLLPDGFSAESTTLQLQASDGTWADAQFRVSGQYLVFPASADTQALRLQVVPISYTPYICAAAGLLVVLLTSILLLWKKRKK